MSSPTVIKEEYDIVIAGGGTAACVVAGRLAAADASLRVLLLEAGPTTYNDPAHTQSLRCLSHIAPGSRTVRAHVSQPSAALGGRTTTVACGQCLGGGGSVNFMAYVRPSASDYDDWETVYKNPGWGSKDLIPFLKKIETYRVPGGGATHGTDGPLALRAHFDPDRAQKPDDADLNDLETINVALAVEVAQVRTRHRALLCASPAQRALTSFFSGADGLTPETGTRSDVPHNMIYPLKDTRPNLHFLTGVHVKHITFDDENRATGVAYAFNPLFHPDGPGDTRTVRATKLVLVSAGAFGSPGILERSGIGAKDVLERVGVKQRVDLPGVGENYQDHNNFDHKYFAADEAQSLDAILRNVEGGIDGVPSSSCFERPICPCFTAEYDIAAAAAEFGTTKKEISMQSALDAGIKWRPTPSEVTELGPEFQEYWNSHFANAPDKPVLRIGMFSGLFENLTAVPLRKYFTLAIYTEYPLARGHVHITHADDVSAPVDFVPGFFELKADVQPLTWGYKFAREIARRMPHFRDPTTSPLALLVFIFVAGEVGTSYHSLGTCAMKPREQGGVIDAKLNVYGVRGLKVADLSIPPSNVSANTYGTALVIGEKAAAIIAEELGIKGVV
ncbi:alcohol oxidase-like protein [Lactarius vividus]|nr:alcohol oxidase-like protein [Lactarius vividus]